MELAAGLVSAVHYCTAGDQGVPHHTHMPVSRLFEELFKLREEGGRSVKIFWFCSIALLQTWSYFVSWIVVERYLALFVLLDPLFFFVKTQQGCRSFFIYVA
jgi:hypothetical protein